MIPLASPRTPHFQISAVSTSLHCIVTILGLPCDLPAATFRLNDMRRDSGSILFFQLFIEHELHVLRRVLPLHPASKIDIDVSSFRCSFLSAVHAVDANCQRIYTSNLRRKGCPNEAAIFKGLATLMRPSHHKGQRKMRKKQY